MGNSPEQIHGRTTFYAGAKAVSIVLTIALQVIGILQVNNDVPDASFTGFTTKAADSTQLAFPALGSAFVIVFLASMILAIEAAIDLASLARPRIDPMLHPVMYKVQQCAPGLTIAAVLLSLLLLVANGSGLVTTNTFLPFVTASLVCVVLETPFIMLVFFDLAGDIATAQAGLRARDMMMQPAVVRVHNKIDPMLDYLDNKREGA